MTFFSKGHQGQGYQPLEYPKVDPGQLNRIKELFLIYNLVVLNLGQINQTNEKKSFHNSMRLCKL